MQRGCKYFDFILLLRSLLGFCSCANISSSTSRRPRILTHLNIRRRGPGIAKCKDKQDSIIKFSLTFFVDIRFGEIRSIEILIRQNFVGPRFDHQLFHRYFGSTTTFNIKRRGPGIATHIQSSYESHARIRPPTVALLVRFLCFNDIPSDPLKTELFLNTAPIDIPMPMQAMGHG